MYKGSITRDNLLQFMLGESLEKFITDNKKSRRDKAFDCLDFLRGLSDEDIKKNPCDFLEVLSLLIELINDKNPYDQISMEEIGTDSEEIKSFEEKSILVEDSKCTISKEDILLNRE